MRKFDALEWMIGSCLLLLTLSISAFIVAGTYHFFFK